MLLSGLTFIRNAKKYDFPIVECIRSMLPIVDELVVNIGKSDDGTEELIASIDSPKIKIIHSVWDDSKTEKGLVLSEQTNIALDACQGRWCLYLQADEAIHEMEHSRIMRIISEADAAHFIKDAGGTHPKTLKIQAVDALRFKYLHFYGGYSMVQRPWNWYPSEIRVVRRASGARSFGDAQTFRTKDGGMLNAQLVDAHVFHYGHAREPEKMSQKISYFHRFWHGDNHGKNTSATAAYALDIKNLVWFWDTHPAVYAKRVADGAAWSVKPSELSKERVQRIVVFGGAELSDTREELLRLLEKHFPQAELVDLFGPFQWLRNALRMAFKPKFSVLIDLDAESRPWYIFVGWIWDALLLFRKRIAHVPKGRMPNWRAKFYTHINWGAPENAAEGYLVPEFDHVNQILRWMGVDV